LVIIEFQEFDYTLSQQRRDILSRFTD
jgi:hypothetical protein